MHITGNTSLPDKKGQQAAAREEFNAQKARERAEMAGLIEKAIEREELARRDARRLKQKTIQGVLNIANNPLPTSDILPENTLHYALVQKLGSTFAGDPSGSDIIRDKIGNEFYAVLRCPSLEEAHTSNMGGKYDIKEIQQAGSTEEGSPRYEIIS